MQYIKELRGDQQIFLARNSTMIDKEINHLEESNLYKHKHLQDLDSLLMKKIIIMVSNKENILL